MLILTRRIGEAVMIGDIVKVTVMRVNRKNEVSIGVDAPREVAVDREEVYERKKQGLPPPVKTQT